MSKSKGNHNSKAKAVSEAVEGEERPVLADALMFADTAAHIKRTHGMSYAEAVKMVDLAVSFKIAVLSTQTNPFGQSLTVDPAPADDNAAEQQEA